MTLDHVILRAADPGRVLAELSRRVGAPVLVPVDTAGAFTSGIMRAGTIDIEVLAIGSPPRPRVTGYGLGFTADVPLAAVSAQLRAAGHPTSAATRATANGRTWSAIQVHGLLPDPFPLPASAKPPGPVDRVTAAVGSVLTRSPRSRGPRPAEPAGRWWS